MRKRKQSKPKGQPQTKLLFQLQREDLKYTVLALSANNTVTVIRKLPEGIEMLLEVTTSKKGISARAKQDIVLMVTGNGAKNSVVKEVFYARVDEKKKNKKVFVPKSAIVNKHAAKALRWANQSSKFVPGGYENMLLYRNEIAVEDSSMKNHYWITTVQELKEFQNNLRDKKKVAA